MESTKVIPETGAFQRDLDACPTRRERSQRGRVTRSAARIPRARWPGSEHHSR
jgi:hypothetical protein